jgi:CheY-like chemotaxis protein/signal transduction histidine kinase
MTTRARSVVDYDTEESLRRALLSVDLLDDAISDGSGSGDDGETPGGAMSGGGHHDSLRSSMKLDGFDPNEDVMALPGACDLDWVLHDADPETSEVQSVEQELRRLQVLKTYLVLDSERDKCFERYTDLSSRLFECPVSMISLIDIGRAWVLANVGVDERIREGPRKLAFCAHTILSSTGVMVINDSLQDPRFCTSPYATEGGIRFYAGVSLVCPEGYKLGTLCVVDSKPRPQGISDKELQFLKDLAAMLVDTMVARRKRMEQESSTHSAELIACTSHDLLTPLSGVLLSLSLLKDDDTIHNRLDNQQLDLLATAATCTDFVVRLCESSIDSLRSSSAVGSNKDGSETRSNTGSTAKVTRMIELLKSFRTILEPIPRRVPLVVQLDANTPASFACDDLKLFRCAMNLLSSAIARTSAGSVHLLIGYQKEELLFECHDTAPSIPESQFSFLYKPCSAKDGDLRLSLSSVARTVQSLGGVCGFYPRTAAAAADSDRAGSVFWFRVPSQPDDANRSAMANAVRHLDPVVGVPASAGPTVTSISNPSSSTAAGCTPETEALKRGAACFGQLFDSVVAEIDVSSRKRTASIEQLSDPRLHVNETHAPVPNPVHAKANTTVSTPSNTDSSPQAGIRRQPRALVIDDSLVVRKSMGMALKKLGFDVRLAVDGLEGLNAMKDVAFDLVFCDFLMPVMDGLDCVKQYREWEASSSAEASRRPHEFRQLIVGISAHADSSVAAQGLAAGMNDFRSKPIGVKILKELVESEMVRAVSTILESAELARDAQAQPSDASHVVENDTDSDLSGRSALQAGSRALNSSQRSGDASGSRDADMVDRSSPSTNKRLRSDRGWRNAEPNCLIVTGQSDARFSGAITQMEAKGWKFTVVHEASVAFRMLQTRNWDAVLIDGDVAGLSAAPVESFLTKFRTWERQNRVNMQKNVCWLTDLPLPPLSDTTTSVVLAPVGYDRVLQKPLNGRDLEFVVVHHTESTMTIVVNK